MSDQAKRHKKNVNVVIDDTDKKIGPVCADKDDVI